jgi:hypothetical protein
MMMMKLNLRIENWKKIDREEDEGEVKETVP